MYIVFDLETTGLVKCSGFNIYPNYTEMEPYNSARIVQIAWVLLDNNFKIVEERNYVVKRDGFNIPPSKYHNITNEISDRKGVNFKIISCDLQCALKRSTMVVAHNILFDYNVLANHLFRYKMDKTLSLFLKQNRFCTSIEASYITKIPLANNPSIYRFPSLSEVYNHYFNKPIIGHHDALADAITCADCFVMILADFKIIKPPITILKKT